MKKTNEYYHKPIKTMSLDELQNLQQKKLKKQIQYVYKNSKFYQRKFREIGLLPEDIQSVQDLCKIPLTSKEELRESQAQHPPLGYHMAAPMEKVIRIHSSSGTTRQPGFVGITKHDQRVWTRITARPIYTQGTGSLPRYETKAQLIKKLWEDQ
jgi:phenylacetate-CoA ligase